MTATSEPRFSYPREAVARARRGDEPRPTVLEIHPAPTCQLRCAYCHSMAPPDGLSVYTSGEQLVKPAEYAGLFEEFSNLGGKELVVSGGGEPLIYKDIRAVIRQAVRHSLTVHLYTNGLIARYFREPEIQWLKYVSTVRLSLHRSEFIQTALESLARCCDFRDKSGAKIVVAASILPATFPQNQLAETLARVAVMPLDLVELRPVLGANATPEWLATAREQLTRNGFPLEKIHCRRVQKGCGVPTACYALYRSVVIDPFGGFRICCMRAHRPQTDLAYLGNLRNVSLDAALRIGIDRMLRAGASVCDTCAGRDSEFSKCVG